MSPNRLCVLCEQNYVSRQINWICNNCYRQYCPNNHKPEWLKALINMSAVEESRQKKRRTFEISLENYYRKREEY